MNKQEHRLFRLKLDFGIPADEIPGPVQDRMSKLVESTLTSVLEEIFSEFSSPDIRIYLDHLELDLGSVPFKEFETELPERLGKALRLELFRILKSSRHSIRKEAEPQSDSLIKAFQYFLEKGYFPWWFSIKKDWKPLQMLTSSIRKNPGEVAEVIRRSGRSEFVRKRIVRTFLDPEIQAIIQLLEPAESPFLVQFAANLQTQHEREPILSTDHQTFRNVKWELILTYLLDRRGSFFNRKSFIRQTLRNMAARYRLEYDFFLDQLSNVLQKESLKGKLAGELPELIQLLQQEKEEVFAPSASDLPEWLSQNIRFASSGEAELVRELYEFFEKKSRKIPHPEKIREAVWKKVLEKLWESEAEKFPGFIQRLRYSGSRGLSLLMHFPEKTVRRFLLKEHRDVAQDLLHIQNDLVALSSRQGVPAWKAGQLEKRITAYYLTLFAEGTGARYDARQVVRGLLEELREEAGYRKAEWMEKIIGNAGKWIESGLISSKLPEILEGMAMETFVISGGEWGVDRESGQEEKNALSIHFLPSRETSGQYADRLLKLWKKAPLQLRDVALFQDAASAGTWLKVMVARWPEAETIRFYKSYWPVFGAFSSSWHHDLSLILNRIDVFKTGKTFQSKDLWGIIWEASVQLGKAGMSQTALVRKSLRIIAGQWGLSLADLFHPIQNFVGKEHEGRFQLERLLPAILTEMAQTDPLLDVQSREDQKQKKQYSFSLAIADLQAFFSSPDFPRNFDQLTLMETLEKWSNRSPQSFKLWLMDQIREPFFPERLLQLLSGKQSMKLITFLSSQGGDYFLALEQLLEQKGFWKEHAGLAGKEYWRTVWKQLQKNVNKALPLSFVVQEVINQLLLISDSAQTEKWIRRIPAELVFEKKSPLDKIVDQLFFSTLVLKAPVVSDKPGQPSASLLDYSTDEVVEWLRGKDLKSRNSFEEHLKSLLSWMESQGSSVVRNFWKKVLETPALPGQIAEVLDDRTIIALSRQISPESAPLFTDIALSIRALKVHQGEDPIRLFPPGLSFLLLKGLLDDRGSLSNQRNFLRRLLSGWAKNHNLHFPDLIRALWPIVKEISPSFRYSRSLDVFREVVLESLPEDELLPLSLQPPLEKPENTAGLDEKKPYKKLWEKDDEPMDFSEVWLISNAGMVLIWPYLGPLFERAGYIEDSKFVSLEAQQKAVYLLEYLMRGEVIKEEYQLVLNKVLCNHPLEVPLEVSFQPDESIEELCEGLLQAVIAYWSVLQDTSVQALRETFLLREGTLGLTEKGWYLQIPQKSYDILLSQLPWGISVVNLSWMEKPMEVKWM